MRAVNAIGGAAVTAVNHNKKPSAAENLQQIQQEAIKEHQGETSAVSNSGVNLKA